MSLVNPVIVGSSPYRSNISYSVKPLPSLDDFCNDIAQKLMVNGIEYPKTIIFCRSYSDCSTIYIKLCMKLGNHFTFPPGYPDFHEYRLVELYSRASTQQVKDEVIFFV